MNCLLFEKSEINSDSTLFISGTKYLHIQNILKLKINDDIKIGIIGEGLGYGKILKIDNEKILVSYKINKSNIIRPNINLILAMPRPKVMKRLWEQLAAIGINNIFIICPQKTEKCYFESHTLRNDIYRPLLIKGLQQACDIYIPKVFIEPNFKKFLKKYIDFNFSNKRFIADVNAKSFITDFKNDFKRNDNITIAIGPEGGWVKNEIKCFYEIEFMPITLGKRILKVDTAVISILSIIRSLTYE